MHLYPIVCFLLDCYCRCLIIAKTYKVINLQFHLPSRLLYAILLCVYYGIVKSLLRLFICRTHFSVNLRKALITAK